MEVKGIVLTNTEHNLGQYADNTELILDGSDQSLRAAINTLNEFYEMSGLEINLNKSKGIGNLDRFAGRTSTLSGTVENLK